MPDRRISIKGPKNYDIPARLYTPSPCREPTHCAVVAHPYFHHGGSMDNPVVVKLAKTLQSVGWVCLTFDFRGHRGAGAGRGASWRGHVERADLQSCVDWLLHAYESLTHVCLAGYSYGALVASACLPHPVPDRRVECAWLFVSLPLDAYKYSLWMFPKPRRTCDVKYIDPPPEAPPRDVTARRRSISARVTAVLQSRRGTNAGLAKAGMTIPEDEALPIEHVLPTLVISGDDPATRILTPSTLPLVLARTTSAQRLQREPSSEREQEQQLRPTLSQSPSVSSLRPRLFGRSTSSMQLREQARAQSKAESKAHAQAAQAARQSAKDAKPRVLAIWGERDEFASKSRMQRKAKPAAARPGFGFNNGGGGGGGGSAGWECEILPGRGHWIDDVGDDSLELIAERVLRWVDAGLG